ncbi:MAG: TlyA family RNA methyltransferase [Anaerolineales bacterium]
MGADKERLDVLVHQRGLAPSREMAQRYIRAGEVRVDGQISDKPGMKIARAATISVDAAPRYASRGGEKLAGAFAAFPLDVAGQVCADVGASTGGFTDVLLQADAARVYALDVGYGLLLPRLRNDPRVVVMERTNARYVDTLPEAVSFVSIDASFISLRLLLPAVERWLTPDAAIVALVKPQFEAGKQDVGKGGVIKDVAVHRRVLGDVLGFASERGFHLHGLIPSPLPGPKGNLEYLAWLRMSPAADPRPLAEWLAQATQH